MDPTLALPPSQPPSLPPVTWRFPSHMFESFIQASAPDYEDVPPVKPLSQQHQHEYLSQHELQPDLKQQQVHSNQRQVQEYLSNQQLHPDLQKQQVQAYLNIQELHPDLQKQQVQAYLNNQELHPDLQKQQVQAYLNIQELHPDLQKQQVQAYLNNQEVHPDLHEQQLQAYLNNQELHPDFQKQQVQEYPNNQELSPELQQQQVQEYLKQEFHPDLEQQIHKFKRRHGEFYFKQKERYEAQQKEIEDNIKDQVQRYQEQQHRQHLEYLQTQEYIKEQQSRLCADLEAFCEDEFNEWQCEGAHWLNNPPVSAPPQFASDPPPQEEIPQENGLDFRAGGKTRTTFPVKMATQAQQEHPIMLHLHGVTTDSSSDDASLPTMRKSAEDVHMSSLQRHRKDLSMDSGIQGSSCDLADCSDPDETAEDQQPSSHAEYESIKFAAALSADDAGEIIHGETFNLVEEVVVEDLKNRCERKEADTLYRATPRKVSQESVERSQSNAHRSLENGTGYAPKKHRRKKAISLAEGNTSTISLDGQLPSLTALQERTGRQLSSSLNSVVKPPRAFLKRGESAQKPFSSVSTLSREDSQVVLSDSLEGTSVETAVCRDVDKTVSIAAPQPQDNRFVVVAIDFGTTYSGYAFSFIQDRENNVHMMRKWEGGDPGLNNQKIPTTLLLTPAGEFHSFGFCARDYFHDLDPQQAKKWLFLDKFKMALHDDQDVSRAYELRAANGRLVPAVRVFGVALRYLKELVLTELSDQVGAQVLAEDVRWVLTVPAIWRQPAKQLMREAAYKAGLCDPAHPEGLLIALEPECASICCRKLRLNHLVPERMTDKSGVWSSTVSLPSADCGPTDLVLPTDKDGLRYVVVDCGGGTVDITVHELSEHWGTLRELHRATGGPWGSVRVDHEFELLLQEIFGADFINQFKAKRPAAYVELMLSFEARKRSATPYKDAPLNVFPPFAFIDYYRKCSGKEVEHAVKKLGRKEITWSSQGMLRLQPSVMRELFGPTVKKIVEHIRQVLDAPSVGTIEYLFLVGGFSESQILQCEVRTAFKNRVNVIIPQGVSLAILRGAVLFGLNPALITTRRAKHTYGVGIMKRFNPNLHPRDKLVVKDGAEWCADILDKFVLSEQAVELGESVVRRYTPASPSQSRIVINIYCADSEDVHFITDEGVSLCGTLTLDLKAAPTERRLEIHTRMVFGGTEISASALDVCSGRCVQTDVDFLTS